MTRFEIGRSTGLSSGVFWVWYHRKLHESSLLRMEWFVETYAHQLSSSEIKVLDVGSYDVNGSYRSFFPESRFRYTGLDMEAGPNVDIVPAAPYEWSEVATDSYDILISGQAFEHIEFFWKTMEEMTRVLRPGGLMCVIAPNGFGEHRYPVDCYRFFTDGLVALARYVGLDIIHASTNLGPNAEDSRWFSDNQADAMMVASKPYAGKPKLPNFKTYTCDPADHQSLRGTFTDQIRPVPQVEESHQAENVPENLIQTRSPGRLERVIDRGYGLVKRRVFHR